MQKNASAGNFVAALRMMKTFMFFDWSISLCSHVTTTDVISNNLFSIKFKRFLKHAMMKDASARLNNFIQLPLAKLSSIIFEFNKEWRASEQASSLETFIASIKSSSRCTSSIQKYLKCINLVN